MRRTLRGAGAAIAQFDRSPNAEGHGPIAGAGEVAGGQRATVRGGHGPTLDMGAGEAAGGLGATARGGQGPAHDRSLKTGRRGAGMVAAGGKRS
jgi:hypothetical protein